MKLLVKITDVTKVEADVVAVFYGSEEAKKLDRALGGMLTEISLAEDFENKQGKLLLIHTHGKIPARRVLIIGNPDELTMANWQNTFAVIGRKAKEVAAKRIAIAISHELLFKNAAQGAVEGLVLGTYVFSKHKSEETRKKEKYIDEVLFLVHPSRLNAISLELEKGKIVSNAVIFARDLINEPPSTTTPSYLASIAKKLPGIHAQIFGKKEMKELGMEALLGIARGSDEEPKFIRLDYHGGGRKTICLVGKGITFDTGGLSLKPSQGMETMKLDMAGAAAILGIFKVLPLLKPKVNVVGLISATENMPGPRAIKPGDIVRAMNGKTIEILNTDAEGRVVLADALSYAGKMVKPEVIIDLATLTGACMVALGEEITGLFGTDAKLTALLKESAVKTGENVWEMPLAKEYKEQIKSSVADVKNITGTKYGGAITAALFLQEFVPEKTPWAHLDIAGPSFAEKDAALTPVGGTGFGVRMILQYLQSI